MQCVLAGSAAEFAFVDINTNYIMSLYIGSYKKLLYKCTAVGRNMLIVKITNELNNTQGMKDNII